ncbi:MAG: hypothetical protein H6828_12480 [Planctomycetes bacterium]|nr:hypothetical protein [Planctomycetota bacterium]
MLLALGALEPAGGDALRVTELGRRLVELPLAPRLGRLVLAGARRGVAREAAACAALLSERPPFRREVGARDERHGAHESDLLDAVYALEASRRRRHSQRLRRAAARARAGVLRVRDALLGGLRDEVRVDALAARDDATRHALLRPSPTASAPARAGRRARRDGRRRGVRLAPECGGAAELFVASTSTPAGREPGARPARSSARGSTSARSCARASRASTRRSRASRRASWSRGASSCSRSASCPPCATTTPRALFAAAREARARARPAAPDAAALLARYACAREWRPELDWPVRRRRWCSARSRTCAPVAPASRSCAARRSPTLRARLGWERCARSTRPRPSGCGAQRLAHRARVRTRPPAGARRAPAGAVRLRETPRVAQGRVKVLLHLCAPNMRPQQVTDDLRASGARPIRWCARSSAGATLHAWPEDPWSAQAVRGVPRRKDGPGPSRGGTT